MADANHKPTTSDTGEGSKPAENQLSYSMQRFLDGRQDEHLMHENTTNQMSARSRGIQTAIDRVNELGLAGRSVGRK
ncbi:hypothetical protein DE146DRAFT_758209 [Phaeosphaeria sp. MPI-PUGE-AT-0046c]|nr:hypothetical protein DE146DRAFT_758209 [Phaeosphaeria sp. MPI-PUGE-AT-0046c]